MQEPSLIVAPHPDDETIGAAIWMARHRSFPITLLHLTGGSPRDPSAALAAGCPSRQAYADERRRELLDALSAIPISPQQLRSFSYVDQESHLCLPELILRLVSLVQEIKPVIVLSPAYEGGHPDHDTAAFAVAAARRQIAYANFHHLEYRLYHADRAGSMITETFLPHPTIPVESYRLSEDERKLKIQMLASFRTQQDILKRFTLYDEQFRQAPSYDFSRPPHDGMLLYERWGFPVSGAEWRECVLRTKAAR